MTASGKERILSAAESLLVDGGTAALTARRVAALAGVRPGLIHYHFETIHELRVRVLERAAQQWQARFEAIVHGADTISELWRRWRSSMLEADERRAFKLYMEIASFAAANEPFHDTIWSVAQWHESTTAIARLPEPHALARGPAQSREALIALVTTISVGMRFQRLFGVELGHNELARDLEGWLEDLEQHPAPSGARDNQCL